MNKDLSVYLGTSKKTKVFWNPKLEKNPHLITVGGSGSGKTETLKAIMLELKKSKVNSIILDFHNDFKVFADNLVQIDKATLHPLEVQINEKPLDVCYKVSKMIASVFSLGDVQEAIIREAIKAFYAKSGIKDIKKANNGDIELLPFSFFRDIIFDTPIKNQGVPKLLAKISVLFDVDLFMEADGTSLSLNTIIKNLSVIELLDFPTDEVKALVADLLLKKLINFLYIKGKCEDYWLYIIIDEAHRMMYPGSPVELLLRESRKYGVGIVLASQRPTDFSETILANAGTIIAFQESLDKDAVFLSKQLRIPKVNFQKLKTAGLGYYLFSSKDEAEKIQISPVKDRKEYKEIEVNFDEEERSDYFNKELKRIKKEKDKYKALEEDNQNKKITIKELETEISKLNGTIERKDYIINKHDLDVKSYEKDIIKLSHENDKLFDKLDMKHKKIEELEKKIKK
jgi:hypothetical protein